MTTLRRATRALPLPLRAAAGSAACGAVLLLVVLTPLAMAGELDGEAGRTLSVGAAAVLASAAGSAVLAARVAASVRRLREDTVRRLAAADHGTGTPADTSSVELRELARTLDALHLRVRVADEVAGRHRRTADSASAGMFELLSGLVAAEEGARGQLAAELHDTVAQSLMAARARLGGPGRPDPESLHQAADLVAEAEEQVRAIMARTRPAALRDGDLAQAVGALRDDLGLRYGLRVHVHWPAAPAALPLATAVTVYRFFQEALLNVVKHADVDDATVALAVDGDGIVAQVRDHGPGFDPDAVRSERGRHVGLGLLRERARLAGGSLVVASRPGDGTALTLRLPRASTGTAAGEPSRREPARRAS